MLNILTQENTYYKRHQIIQPFFVSPQSWMQSSMCAHRRCLAVHHIANLDTIVVMFLPEDPAVYLAVVYDCGPASIACLQLLVVEVVGVV